MGAIDNTWDLGSASLAPGRVELSLGIFFGRVRVDEQDFGRLGILSQQHPALQPLVGNYSGLTLLVQGDDGSNGSNPPERCVVVASEIVIKVGKAWVR